MHPLLVALCFGGILMAVPKFPDRFHVQAHRGACGELQENTIPALRRAIEVGADSVEFDVQMTKDGVWVLHHDFTLASPFAQYADGRPFSRETAIRSLSYEEVKQVQINDVRRVKVAHSLSPEEKRIPTLSEVFSLFRNAPAAAGMVLDIEIKSDPTLTPPPQVMAKAVIDLVEKEWSLDRTVVRSFDHGVLKEARKMRPDLSLAALTDRGFEEYERVLKELRPFILAPEKNSITKEQVELAHRYDAKVIPFTVNTAEDWSRMIALGVDGATTDDPRGLIQHLHKSSLRNLSLTDFKRQTRCAILGQIR